MAALQESHVQFVRMNIYEDTSLKIKLWRIVKWAHQVLEKAPNPRTGVPVREEKREKMHRGEDHAKTEAETGVIQL